MAKKFKIYNESYDLEKSPEDVPSGYAFRNELFDEPPGGKPVGYVTLEDGSVVQCFKKFNPLPLILLLLICLVACALAYYFLIVAQPKDVVINDTPVKEGTDHDVVTYNGFMSVNESAIDIYFQNGNVPATITVRGEGIKCEPVNVNPGELVEVMPITYDTDKAVINATLSITTSTSTYEQPVIIEVPENNTLASPESGLDNYWQGETVYGIDSSGNATTNTSDDIQPTE